MKKLILPLLLLLFFSSCEDEETSKECPPANRTGAICNDGSQSTATGSGACSNHGGVKTWICK
jgi:hypothetical protein